MKLSKSVFPVLSIALLAFACNSIDFKKTKGGVPYKIYPSKTGEKIVQGNIVKFHIQQKVKDSVIGTSYGGVPVYQQVSPSSKGYDIGNTLMDIFTQAKNGDSIYFVQSIDSFIAHDPSILQNTPFKKGDQLTTTVKILNVFRTPQDARADDEKERVANAGNMEKKNLEQFNKSPQAQEQMKIDSKIIEDYLTANHIQAEKTPWGVYVQMLNPGQGPKPEAGKFALLRYRGTNLEGQEFDSNEKPNAPLYPLQIGMGGSIKGFEEGVKAISKGGKARIFIPSILGYGSAGSPPRIKPNENLIFEVEVVDITDTPPASNQLPGKVDTTQARK